MSRVSLQVFVDILLVMLMIILLPPQNPEIEADTVNPGVVSVEVLWPDSMNTDVDLWMRGPSGGSIGYSNRSGGVWNLLRDDLGHVQAYDRLNYETGFTRGAPKGEYIVNVHLYSNVGRTLPVPVHVVVKLSSMSGKKITIIDTEVVLLRVNHEITVVRFMLDDSGGLVPDSVHSVQKEIRNAPTNRQF